MKPEFFPYHLLLPGNAGKAVELIHHQHVKFTSFCRIPHCCQSRPFKNVHARVSILPDVLAIKDAPLLLNPCETFLFLKFTWQQDCWQKTVGDICKWTSLTVFACFHWHAV